MEFADVALAKFLQAAPELGPAIVNFSVVTEEMGDSESGVQVGVFILSIGGGAVYVPVIGKGETLFPIDSVFIESEGLFKPLSSQTISYLVNSVSSKIGKAKKIPDTVVKNPNLSSLINPPRTGKFIYASASRLPEFLAVVPAGVRKFVFEKIAAEQSIYNNMDKMFGLKAIFSVLNGDQGGVGSVNSVATGPAPFRESAVMTSVITSPQEIQALMNDSLSRTFIDQGYVIQGGDSPFRAAVSYMPYNKIGTYCTVNPAAEGGRDYSICMNDGSSNNAFLPKYHVLNPRGGNVEELVSVFIDGNYARGHLITNGEELNRSEVLDQLFQCSPPKLLKELNRGDNFLMFTSSGQALGPFYANSVTRTFSGVEVKTYAGKTTRICGFNNFTKEVDSIGDTLYVPHNVIVLVLAEDVTNEVERSINSALDKKEISAAQYLGAEINLRHDGVEFSTDSGVLGGFPAALKALVEDEKIEPETAKSFLKQAQEISVLKIFLSKAAASTDFAPAEIPTHGNAAPRQEDIGLNGSFLPAVQSANTLGDAQAMEATIISQLLQVPELFEYIQEYLPELDQTVDRLGRILFLTRVKMDQISTSLDSDSVFTMISQIKTVYRQLSDTTLKLKSIASASVGFDKEKTVGQTNGA